MPLQTFDVSTRKVPSLALVPLKQLHQANRAKKTVKRKTLLKRDEDETEVATEQGTTPDEDGTKAEDAELRLGERFLNMMALMAHLSTQPLGIHSPHRLVDSNTEKSVLLPSPLSPQVKSPLKSPKHVVRDVARRLPRALQKPLTFDICMLLPTPLDERQSPLRSPIRRKRLRKRLRRRKLRRRARRTWQASHASWPPHISADYVVDHARQDIAGISATRLVQRLDERKMHSQPLPRVMSMPLPPLHRNQHVKIEKTNEPEADEVPIQSVDDNDKGDHEEINSDEEIDEEEGEQQEEDDDSSSSQSDESPLPSDNTAAIDSSPPQKLQESDVDRTIAQPKKRPLYHQPAWISPELHAWLIESGLFATKPRRELL